MGDECPCPGTGFFQRTWEVSLQVIGGLAVSETPLASGPRHCGQSSGGVAAVLVMDVGGGEIPACVQTVVQISVPQAATAICKICVGAAMKPFKRRILFKPTTKLVELPPFEIRFSPPRRNGGQFKMPGIGNRLEKLRKNGDLVAAAFT